MAAQYLRAQSQNVSVYERFIQKNILWGECMKLIVHVATSIELCRYI